MARRQKPWRAPQPLRPPPPPKLPLALVAAVALPGHSPRRPRLRRCGGNAEVAAPGPLQFHRACCRTGYLSDSVPAAGDAAGWRRSRMATQQDGDAAGCAARLITARRMRSAALFYAVLDRRISGSTATRPSRSTVSPCGLAACAFPPSPPSQPPGAIGWGGRKRGSGHDSPPNVPRAGTLCAGPRPAARKYIGRGEVIKRTSAYSWR
jgi:hypothetical protein